MSATPTLNSRLRVLVAKTFKAEKLYSSIRNSRADKLANVASLSDMANDIRAKEWQRAHYRLRASLNDILSLPTKSAIIAELLKVRESFLQKAVESEAAIEKNSGLIDETVRRFEFARSLKISVELIQEKACAQANRVISDELGALLDSSGAAGPNDYQAGEVSGNAVKIAAKMLPPSQFPEAASSSEMPSNVIPLKRRFAAGTRRGR